MAYRKRRSRTYSKAVRRQGTMNATEAWYKSEVLDRRVKSGDLVKVVFEGWQVILVHPDPTTKPKRKASTYLPDFYCVRDDGGIEFHEVKGPPPDEADRLKIKMSAEMYPEFRWRMVQIGNKKIRKEEEF